VPRPRPRQPQSANLVSLGRAVRSLREQQSFTARDLAEAVGASPAQIDELEQGRLDPDFELLLRLADSLGVRLSTLFGRAEALHDRTRPGAPGDEQ
jgi:XRE family transcriptional regulator, fatty acid utilization regulator